MPLGVAETMPADAWQVQPREPLGVGQPPQEHPEQVPQDACRRSAPRLLEASHLAPHHFPTPARMPIVGSESLGLCIRPARECADPMWWALGPGTQGSRTPPVPRVGIDIAPGCGCAPSRFGRGCDDIQGILLRPVMDHRLMQLLPGSFESRRNWRNRRRRSP